jgi:uncharacterized RDD family membrane protein YckC
MREDYRLLTPENVELQFDVAGLGSRTGAALIDHMIIGVAYFGLILAAAFTATFMQRILPLLFGSQQTIDRVTNLGTFVMIALAVFLGFVGWWGYFLLFELLWTGQSPGKRAMSIRVVRRDGQPLTFTTALVRNSLRWIDGPTPFPIGIFVMLVDQFSRRLGDLAGGTFVVHEPRSIRTRALDAVAIPYTFPEATVQALPNAGRITMEHYTLIRDYFGRAPGLGGEAALRLALRLAEAFGRQLEVDPSTAGNPQRFLALVARAFELRHQYTEASPSSMEREGEREGDGQSKPLPPGNLV